MNYHKLACILIAACFTSVVDAQPGSWDVVKQGVGKAYGQKVVSDNLGNFIAAGVYEGYPVSFGGSTLSDTLGNFKIYLVKYSHSGLERWTHGIYYLGCSPSFGIGTDREGNVYLTAGFGSTTTLTVDTITRTIPYGSGQHCFLTKFDSAGHVQWLKIITNGDYVETPTDMYTDDLGNCYITGWSQSTKIGFANDTIRSCWGPSCSNSFLAKFDANGNAIWGRSAVLLNQFQTANVWSPTLTTDHHGNFYMAATYEGLHTVIYGNDTLAWGDGVVVKYDSSGQQHWVRTLFKGQPNVAAANENAVYLSGSYRYSAVSMTDTFNNSYQASTYNSFIVKFDAAGNELFMKNIDGPGNQFVNDIETIDSGQVWFTLGTDSTYIVDGISVQKPIPSTYPVILLRADSTMNILETVPLQSGMYGGLHFSRQHELYLTGTSGVDSLSLPPYYVLASQNLGYNYAPFVARYWTNSTTGLPTAKNPLPVIYPNPATEWVTLNLGKPATTSHDIALFSASGALVKTWVCLKGKESVTINLRGINPGAYFIKTQGGVARLIIQQHH